jgi:DNA-binding beta-propeller fold protein YncE
MKSLNTLARIASLLLVCAFASASSAAKTNPLIYPRGLAVDSKGYLWVANSRGNNILVFSPGYAQQKTRTITQGISNPTGVAIDSMGNLWVSNYGNSSVSEYTSGTQNTGATITNGIVAPDAIVVDGAGNVWVENDYSNVTVYAPASAYAQPYSLVTTLAPTSPMLGIAVSDGAFAWGSYSGTSLIAATPALANGAISGYSYGNDTGVALASDASGNIYMGNADGTVNISSPLGYEYGPFAQLSFAPGGIAIDNVRGRVYISNDNNNSISVYSTAGALLKVIQ